MGRRPAQGEGLTRLLRLARKAGVTRIADGMAMLAERAAEAFLWWRGARPAIAEVMRVLTSPLARAA